MSESLFTVQTPAVPDIDNAAPITVGTVIIPAVAGTISQGRWFTSATPPGGTCSFVLWDLLTEAELARKTFTTAVGGGWILIPLTTPINVAANQIVVASVESTSRYCATGGFFNAAPLVNGNLTGPRTSLVTDGNGRYGTPTAYPDQTFNGNLYFADIVFDATPTARTSDFFLFF